MPDAKAANDGCHPSMKVKNNEPLRSASGKIRNAYRACPLASSCRKFAASVIPAKISFCGTGLAIPILYDLFKEGF